MKPVAAVLLFAALLVLVVPSCEAGRVIHGSSQKNFKGLMPKLPGCSPPPAPVEVAPYTPTTPDTYTPTTPDTYTPTPLTPSEPSPVYTPPTSTAPPAGGY